MAFPSSCFRVSQEPYSAFMGTTPQWANRDGARLALVPNAAHNANQDSPDFVNGQITSFLTHVA